MTATAAKKICDITLLLLVVFFTVFLPLGMSLNK